MFGSFATDQVIYGSDSYIKGDNYEQFKMDQLSSSDPIEEIYDTPKEIYISPSMIEGIKVGEHEIENPSMFWSRKMPGGTMESFKEVAAHIPDVKEQLANGKTMSEVRSDPVLSACARIYFSEKPEVFENDGYYELEEGGRHRILAAREAGYCIPVKVIGRRKY